MYVCTHLQTCVHLSPQCGSPDLSSSTTEKKEGEQSPRRKQPSEDPKRKRGNYVFTRGEKRGKKKEKTTLLRGTLREITKSHTEAKGTAPITVFFPLAKIFEGRKGNF